VAQARRERHRVQYRVLGMDCARDAADIEEVARGIPGVVTARVSAASHILTVSTRASAARLADLETAVARLGYRLEPLADDTAEVATAGRHAVHTTPAYRRALWIVVLLNLGYGAVEMAGGFLASSQALKADALDFVGDGLITMLGLLAIGWSLAWRARAALIQGLFLAVLGAGVLVMTVYRVLVPQQPHAEAMGLLAVGALAVNLAAAAVLIPHRSGDANVRAVWLFSRNDAIGNVAVVVAAALVAVTASAWPDLVVAFLIAGLFLHSSWSIIVDARQDLHESAAAVQRPPSR
jgi:Co/Zn/Cd efflux system component/copper chaperone CopZ